MDKNYTIFSHGLSEMFCSSFFYRIQSVIYQLLSFLYRKINSINVCQELVTACTRCTCTKRIYSYRNFCETPRGGKPTVGVECRASQALFHGIP